MNKASLIGIGGLLSAMAFSAFPSKSILASLGVERVHWRCLGRGVHLYALAMEGATRGLGIER